MTTVTQTTTVQFCINCKHLVDTKCQRPDGLSLVTGIAQLRNVQASCERTYNYLGCGEKAKYFISKE